MIDPAETRRWIARGLLSVPESEPLRLKCCGEWFPCYECHEAVADRPARVWPLSERDQDAVLCGVCGPVLSIESYLASDSTCPRCGAAFNPGCQTHYHLYFEVG